MDVLAGRHKGMRGGYTVATWSLEGWWGVDEGDGVSG